MTDIELSLCMAEQIYELTQLIRRDGLANSLGHVQKIEQRAKALIAISKGEKPDLPF